MSTNGNEPAIEPLCARVLLKPMAQMDVSDLLARIKS